MEFLVKGVYDEIINDNEFNKCTLMMDSSIQAIKVSPCNRLIGVLCYWELSIYIIQDIFNDDAVKPFRIYSAKNRFITF